VIGGAGADTITVTAGTSHIRGGGGIDHVTGGSGADTFVFDQNSAGSHMVVMNMGTGADRIGLDTDANSTVNTNTYDTTGSLTNNGNIKAVANSAALLSTTLTTGGKGGFVYQQDTGELYFSTNGDFTSGGTLIGVITTDGSTPWTYDFTKFIDV
jgi:Ca2+-binding RTX toxin-like protein